MIAIKRIFTANLLTLLVFVTLSMAGSWSLRFRVLPRLAVASESTSGQAQGAHAADRTAQVEEFKSLHAWTTVAQAISLLLCAMLCGVGLAMRNIARRQISDQERAERELTDERHALEVRVEERTRELRLEVEERKRAEELIQGQKQVLEMMASPAHKTEDILGLLTGTVAAQRRTRESSLHLMDQETRTLRLAAASEVSDRLRRYLATICADFADAPESQACNSGQNCVVKRMTNVRRPWSELLVANGIFSAWSVPLRAESSSEVVGALTVYSRLHDGPSPRDLEAVETAARLAALVVEHRRIHSELVHNAYQDVLTGLPNRRAGEQAIEDAIEQCSRRGESFLVLRVDLNRFKRVNDHYGHGAGDTVLRTIATRLRQSPLITGTVARMGGDEFLVLIPAKPGVEVPVQIASELCAVIAKPISVGGAQVSVTASIGICNYPQDGATIEELERNADLAMFQAKAQLSGSCSYSEEMSRNAGEALELEQALSVALEQNHLSIVYQPIYARDGGIAGFESLARFNHPVLGSISPARFIPVAEETRMIVPIGTWALRQACSQLKAWHDAGHQPVYVTVNISALQFARDDFAETVAGILNDCRLSPEHLLLELTESVVMEDYATVLRQMNLLKQLGVRIGMDDFGTGYSSLSYIHKLPIDMLKIDRSFIERLADTDGTRPIVEAVIAMAGHLGVQVVAEGVETAEQRFILQLAGCDAFQGFLFARPQSPEGAERCLIESSLAESSPRKLPQSIKGLPEDRMAVA